MQKQEKTPAKHEIMRNPKHNTQKTNTHDN